MSNVVNKKAFPVDIMSSHHFMPHHIKKIEEMAIWAVSNCPDDKDTPFFIKSIEHRDHNGFCTEYNWLFIVVDFEEKSMTIEAIPLAEKEIYECLNNPEIIRNKIADFGKSLSFICEEKIITLKFNDHFDELYGGSKIYSPYKLHEDFKFDHEKIFEKDNLLYIMDYPLIFISPRMDTGEKHLFYAFEEPDNNKFCYTAVPTNDAEIEDICNNMITIESVFAKSDIVYEAGFNNDGSLFFAQVPKLNYTGFPPKGVFLSSDHSMDLPENKS